MKGSLGFRNLDFKILENESILEGLDDKTTPLPFYGGSSILNLVANTIPVADFLGKLVSTDVKYDLDHKVLYYSNDRIMENGVSIHSLPDIEYVLNAVNSVAAKYFLTDTDDPTGYKLVSLEEPTGEEASITLGSLSNNDYITGWISDNITITKLVAGVYSLNIEAEKVSGNKILRIYWKVFERKTDTSEIEIATSSTSDIIDERASYIVPLSLSLDYFLSVGSRLVWKIYADVSGNGGAPVVTLYYNGLTTAHMNIPTNTEVLTSLYLPYEGARKNVNLGNFTLTGTDILIPGLSSNANSGDVPSEDYNWFKGVFASLVDGSVKSWIIGLVNQMKSLAARVGLLEDNYILRYVVPVDTRKIELTTDKYGNPFNFGEGDILEILFALESTQDVAKTLMINLNGVEGYGEYMYNNSTSYPGLIAYIHSYAINKISLNITSNGILAVSDAETLSSDNSSFNFYSANSFTKPVSRGGIIDIPITKITIYNYWETNVIKAGSIIIIKRK